MRAGIENLNRWTSDTSSRVYLVAMLASLGAVLPWYLGLEFLDAVTWLLYGCTPLVFVATASGEASLEVVPQDEATGRTLTIAAGGAVYSLLILLAGLAVVNLKLPRGAVVFPPAITLLSTVALVIAVSAFAAAIGARLSDRGYRPNEIKGALRRNVLVAVMVTVLGWGILPAGVREWVGPWLTTPVLAVVCALAALALGIAAIKLSGPESHI